MSRAYAYTVSAVLLGAVMSPVLLDAQDPRTDSFPLSTYPMFSYDKPRTATVTSAVALGPDGLEVALAPAFIGTSETMQALRTIQNSVRAGRERSAELCKTIAERVASSRDPELARATRVAFVTLTVDSIRYLSGDRTPLARRVEQRCKVKRSDP